jgi:hypothetical protein
MRSIPARTREVLFPKDRTSYGGQLDNMDLMRLAPFRAWKHGYFQKHEVRWMVQGVFEIFNYAPGLGSASLNFWQMAARAIILYVLMLFAVRLSDKMFLSGSMAFDFLVGITISSTAAKAFIGSSPLFPCIGMVMAIIAAHWIFADLPSGTIPLAS